MYLPKSILYPLVILFTLGGVFSFYFEITSIPLFSSLGFTLIFYFLLKEKRTKLLKKWCPLFQFFALRIHSFPRILSANQNTLSTSYTSRCRRFKKNRNQKGIRNQLLFFFFSGRSQTMGE